MNKVIAWLNESHRLTHIGAGVLLGFLSDSTYCAALAGGTAASALEIKDKLWGGNFDWIDFALTLAGTAVGRLIRIAICWI